MKNRTIVQIRERFSGVGKLFFAHNRMIYFALFMCALIGAVASLNVALNQPSDTDYRNEKLRETQSPRFDEDTIEKIKNLNTRQQAITDPPPTNQRINPFGE
jgi:hypothetical protein